MTARQADVFLKDLMGWLEDEILSGPENRFDLAAGLRRFSAWLARASGNGESAAKQDTGHSNPRQHHSVSSARRQPLSYAHPAQSSRSSTALVPAPHRTTLDLDDVQRLRGGPIILRLVLGAQLRRLREASGITREEAGYTIRATLSKISRIELGRTSFKERDVADLLTLYGVTNAQERDAFRYLARQSNAQRWWHSYADILPSWFETYIGLEEAAAVIRSYEVQFVPGLLQTERYARAITQLGHHQAPAEEIDRRVSLRMARQKILTGAQPPTLWAIVDEAALRRPIGGQEIMRDQICHLMEAAALPNVTVQVIPFTAGAPAGAFTILCFAEHDLPDVVYLEQLTTAIFLDRFDDVDHYRAAMDRLSAEVQPPHVTEEILSKILDEL